MSNKETSAARLATHQSDGQAGGHQRQSSVLRPMAGPGFWPPRFHGGYCSMNHGHSLLPFTKKAIKRNVQLIASVMSTYRPDLE